MKKAIIYIGLMLFAISNLTVSAQNKIEIPLRFDHYYTYDEVNQALIALNKAYPKLTKLELVGHSDEDRDGLIDEDPAEDLDGDGFITQMRIRDTLGDYKTDPKDVRLMVRVEKGEKGEFRLLGTEGIDNDNDGRVNEDEPGYIDPNRNFPYNWQPTYVQGGAGSYPLEGKGLKAVADYLYARKNILVAWAFHNSGGMILRGPTSKSAQEYDRRDIEVYDYLGKHGEKMIPGYNYLLSWKDLYTTWGDFGDFTDDIVGAITLVGELFQSKTESYRTDTTKPAAIDEQSTEHIKFNDYLTNGAMYSNWKPYKHPLYGNIEIGGWSKFNSRLPQPFMLMDLVHRNAMAVFVSVFNLPQISLEVFEKEKIGKDLYRIKARLTNSKAVSSITYQSVRLKINPMDYLKLDGKNIRVVDGGPVTDITLKKRQIGQKKLNSDASE